MLIEIDCRERNLHEQCIAYIQRNTGLDNITIKTSNLPLGDIIIYDDSNLENLEEKIIIERKSVNDLAASIRDSRYKEQSYRLGECSLHNHNIFYLIEGDFSRLGQRYNKNTLLSAMTSISYIKGFSLYRTFSIAESAEWIVRMADKLHRSKEAPFYHVQEGHSHNNNPVSNAGSESSYSSVVKRVKKHNITRDNIGEIMLMQIPGVSSASAKAVMERYKSIQSLIKNLLQYPSVLDEITIASNGSNGHGEAPDGYIAKVRKLNKTCKSNIYNYLILNAKDIITINTKIIV